MDFQFLTEENVDLYISYLRRVYLLEPEMMTADQFDEMEIRRRISTPFYQNTKSILALVDNDVVGRIEYHFYGCMQDGCKMAYVDWVYVLPAYRHRGVAQHLFQEFEGDCVKHDIDQYYLLCAENQDADHFYRSFEHAELSAFTILRKNICDAESE